MLQMLGFRGPNTASRSYRHPSLSLAAWSVVPSVGAAFCVTALQPPLQRYM